MGFFNDKKDQIAFLDSERLKIWDRLTKLEESINKRTPDYEKEARQSSKMASEYRNKANSTKDEVQETYNEILAYKNDIISIKDRVIELRNHLDNHLNEMNVINSEVNEIKEKVKNDSDTLEEKIEAIETILANHPNLDEELVKLDEFLNKAEENSKKSTLTLKSIITRKQEIDELYFEIAGYDEENEAGENTFVPGLKDKLDEQYKSLIEDAEKLHKEITIIEKKTSDNFNNFLSAKSTESKNFLDSWSSNYIALENKIKDLLPNALTAGLSSAFSEKKKNEETSFNHLRTQFYIGIFSMILVSLIPFYVSYKFILNGDDWDIVINRIPRIVLAVLPLYLPVLWLTYSANKKINLSKRLIEEYAHKEVLSKTFEGLSTQIEQLGDNDISNELKLKLLHNFLHVSSENPGKLISNYEASDHPIMDVLEKSYMLDNAVEKLQRVPGLSKVSKILEAKSRRLVDEKERIIANGLSNIESQEEDEEDDNSQTA